MVFGWLSYRAFRIQPQVHHRPSGPSLSRYFATICGHRVFLSLVEAPEATPSHRGLHEAVETFLRAPTGDGTEPTADGRWSAWHSSLSPLYALLHWMSLFQKGGLPFLNQLCAEVMECGGFLWTLSAFQGPLSSGSPLHQKLSAKPTKSPPNWHQHHQHDVRQERTTNHGDRDSNATVD